LVDATAVGVEFPTLSGVTVAGPRVHPLNATANTAPTTQALPVMGARETPVNRWALRMVPPLLLMISRAR
jgi:hypothetical protein